jgi:hypothetical protein
MALSCTQDHFLNERWFPKSLGWQRVAAPSGKEQPQGPCWHITSFSPPKLWKPALILKRGLCASKGPAVAP